MLSQSDPGAAERALHEAERLHARQRFDDALGLYEAALRLDPGLRAARWGMTSILEMARTTKFHERLAALLDESLADPGAYHQALARAAAHQLRLKHAIDGARDFGTADGRALIQALDRDRMALNLLRRTVSMDAALERFLTALRRHFLLDDRDSAPDLRAALAQQCINNEHAYWAEPDELAAVASSWARPETRGDGRDLVAVAMYLPLYGAETASLARRPVASWPAAVRPIVQSALIDEDEEAAIAGSLDRFGEVGDATSRAVQAQYEENPYPRWLALPPVPRVDLLPALARAFPAVAPMPPRAGALRVLSAGCGTGQHALCLAASYRDAAVTAFDLSRRSLAYAVRQARRLDLRNVEFFHGDILELDRLGRRFDVIESIGVIHHMADPDAGLASLAGALEPGGLIRLGLYSEHARQEIVAARARIAALGLDSSAPSIRRFRHLLLTDPAQRDLSALTDWDDFFTISAARDLMFHVQEHRYTVPKIQALLRGCGLRFVGFEFLAGFSRSQVPSQAIRDRYRALFPDDPAMASLENWARFEARHPDAFQGYTLWAQKG